MLSSIKVVFTCCMVILLLKIYVYNVRLQNERLKGNEILTVTDVSEQDIIKNKAIFFVETSCKSSNKTKVEINARQACAVESAARLNPNRIIHLLYASTGKFNFSENTESDRFLQALFSYPNVRISHVNYTYFFKNTPVENVYTNGLLENSKYPVTHASDVLRFLILWKYGGIYLDLDVVVLKSLETLALNFAGYESANIGSAVLSFSSSGAGHDIVHMCLLHLQHYFNGDNWSDNGPYVITKIMQEICSNNETQTSKLCKSFKVYRRKIFYPITWQHWKQYFEENTDENIEKLLAESYAVHVWNHMSGNQEIPLDSNVLYLKIARKCCPKVVKQCDEKF